MGRVVKVEADRIAAQVKLKLVELLAPVIRAGFEKGSIIYTAYGKKTSSSNLYVTINGSLTSIFRFTSEDRTQYFGRDSDESMRELKTILDGLPLLTFPAGFDPKKGASGTINFGLTGKGWVWIDWTHNDHFQEKSLNRGVELSDQDWEALRGPVRALGAERMLISYSGSDYSRNKERYEFTDEKGALLAVDQGSSEFSAIHEIFDRMMNGPVTGFEGDEGGYGRIDIFVAEKGVSGRSESGSSWDHYDYIVGSDVTQISFDVSLPGRNGLNGRGLTGRGLFDEPLWG